MKSNIIYISEFLNYITTDRSYISTGFHKLDQHLNGGLSSNLYVLGAMSSVGKTTFSLQLADNIAKSGKGVIIFTIEMTKNDLIAKSLSRVSIENKSNLTYNDILNKDNLEKVKELLPLYESIGKNIYLHEGLANVATIEKVITEYIGEKKEVPVVIVDYLQILSSDTSLSDKQKNDLNVVKLHRMSKKYQLPVWVISALNRSSYDNKKDMASFKESGQIEYEADVLMTLEANNDNIVDLTILKNRYGASDVFIKYNFSKKYNLFEEM